MNKTEIQAEKLNDLVAIENKLLTEHVKKSCTRLQQVVDQTTTFVYKYLQPEIDELFTYLKSGYTGIIYPVVNYTMNDIAPEYDVKTQVSYIISAINPEFNAQRNFLMCFEESFINNGIQDLRPKMRDKIEDLHNTGIHIKYAVHEQSVRTEIIRQKVKETRKNLS